MLYTSSRRSGRRWMIYPCDRQTDGRTGDSAKRAKIVRIVGSRVIVLSLSFFRVLRAARLQLYSPVLGHWSPVINSAAVLSSPWSTRGRCEGIWTQSCMHFILQSWHEEYDQLDVYWWSAAGSWILLNETFESSWRTGTLLLISVLPFYCTTATFAGAFPSADQHAPYVTLTDRRLAPRGRRRRHGPSMHASMHASIHPSMHPSIIHSFISNLSWTL